MRSRTVREGSVGLLILVGLVLFVGLILWIRGVSVGRRSYKVFVNFANVAGMEPGTAVRYRGVTVGKIAETRPGPNGVEVEVEISPPDLIIPKDVVVEANQSGLLGSTSIDITPLKQLNVTADSKPLDSDCNADLIICNKAHLTGQVGASVDELVRASIRFAGAYSDPQFVWNLNSVTKNSAEAAAEIAKLSREFRAVAVTAKQQIGTLSTSTRAITLTASKLGLTADQVNGLLTDNRSNLVSTLNNINLITADLRTTVSGLSPIVNRVQQGELLQNLETLSANAAQASASFRDISQALNSTSNLATLQQTLDSARATFQNAQKITADLDELTGDPAFRSNLRNLVNGLSGLVSSTQQLQHEAQLTQFLLAPAPETRVELPVLTGANDSKSSKMPVSTPPLATSTERSQSQ